MTLSEIVMLVIAFLTATGGFAGFAELRKVKLAQAQFAADQAARAKKENDEAEDRDADLSAKWKSVARDASDEAVTKSTKLHQLEIEFQAWKVLATTREKKADERSQLQAERITELDSKVQALMQGNRALRDENERLTARVQTLENYFKEHGLPIPNGGNK
jgi:predicted  nucleic acid-binding Zn-ribbon protein